MKQGVWLLVLVMLLSSCARNKPIEIERVYDNPDKKVNIYLLNDTKDKLVVTEVQLEEDETAKQASEVITYLEAGYPSQGLAPVLGAENMVNKVVLDGDHAQIHVGDAFVNLNEVELLICRSSIVKSMTSIQGIEGVEFYVEGLPMKDRDGKVYGTFAENDIITNGEERTQQSEAFESTYYYPDDMGEKLLPYVATIEVTATEGVEENVLRQLIYELPPEGMATAIPEGSEIKHIYVNNGICYIDMNEAFRSNHYGGSTGEMMTVYSIVNTMTSLPYIRRVQFLIEGEKTSEYKGHLDFSTLFEYNLDLVGQ